MFCAEGRISLQSFIGTSCTFLSLCTIIVHYDVADLPVNVLITTLYAVNVYFILRYFYTNKNFSIAIRGAFLGLIFALGVYVQIVGPSNVQVFGAYMCVMSFFHYSEFLSIALVQPKQLSVDSYMINHSPQYTVAAVTSWAEFFIETYFFPGLKEIRFFSNVGLVICIGGELLRKVAILTAGSNFNHLVQCEKTAGHVLVTKGVYSWCRHPSYVGWFYWSIGTQLILLNPFCVIAYTVASWMFFKERIYFEEVTLLNFFGQQYCDYQQRVRTGIPFIEGYKI